MISKKTNAPRQPSPAPAASPVAAGVDSSWRSTALLPMGRAATIAGVSKATLYLLHHRGGLELQRVGGRVVIPTAQIARLVDGAPTWMASARGSAARARRREVAQSTWEAADVAA